MRLWGCLQRILAIGPVHWVKITLTNVGRHNPIPWGKSVLCGAGYPDTGACRHRWAWCSLGLSDSGGDLSYGSRSQTHWLSLNSITGFSGSLACRQQILAAPTSPYTKPPFLYISVPPIGSISPHMFSYTGFFPQVYYTQV